MEAQPPPFWFQPPSAAPRRRPQPTPLLNPVALILTIPLLILLILFFLLPSFLSQAVQFLRPNSVKKSWDSLNIVLVLFAILCGVFARWNDESKSSDEGLAEHQIRNGVPNFVSRPRQSVSASAWTDFPEYNSSGGGGIRLRRSSSSYPDLRQESLWESGGGNRAARFFDDFEVNFHRSPPPENFVLRRHEAETETIVREIPVDKFETSAGAAAPPTPPPKANLKRRRSLRSVPRKEKVDKQRDDAEVRNEQRPVTPPPPTPAAEEVPEFRNTEEPSVEVHRKKSGPTKDLATAIASFYKGQRKRKKRVKSRNIYESAAAAESSSPPSSAVEPPSAPPPPPPPPPPTSKVFQNPFKRTTKNKRVHSVSTTAPPPPPPPPPSSIFNTIFKNSRFKNVTPAPPPPPDQPLPEAATAVPRRRQVNSGKPPKPTKQSTLYHENVTIAPPSPLIPLPPPPPPFRMAKAKFVARGDYVRIRSTQSSRCSSPELEDVEIMSVKSDGGDSIGPSVSCPSPDVNAKADSFIARLRDEWRLEKMNSVKGKRRF